MYKKLISILIFLIILSISIIYFSNEEDHPDNYVKDVIDGDTFKINSGETVRILCVDTPEKGDKNYEEAKLFLEGRILNKEVQLKSIGDDKDKYGRILRYVYLNDTMINMEIIENNYSKLYIYGNDTSNCRELIV